MPDDPGRELSDDEKWQQMEEAVRQQEQPQPSQPDRLTQTYDSAEAAIGQDAIGKTLQLDKIDPADNDWLRDQGFTEKRYYVDENGKQYSVHHNPSTGEFAVGKTSSSSSDDDWADEWERRSRPQGEQ